MPNRLPVGEAAGCYAALDKDMAQLKISTQALSLNSMADLSEAGHVEPAPADLIVRGGTIITMDAARTIYNDGAIAVSGDRIVAAGKASDIESRFRAKAAIDAKNGLIFLG